ncbi:heme NO-binding domain-containing protein [Pontixanthobacter sp.]|uniref:heme NO-binding domain-containing protein n=1 Tax=Pontixanthobacter sp. TaxID=2792078 RepID=UPI003C7A73E1
MKGLIFTELMDFMEHKAGAEFAEDVLDAADLPNGGAFTAIGTYPAAYALNMVAIASDKSGIPAAELSAEYGEWLFHRFTVLYPDIIDRYPTAEIMLDHVGSHIHEEVVILYPDAKPPHISMQREDGHLVVNYSSHRPMAHVAFGLVKGCLAHYRDSRIVEWLTQADPTSASFRITDMGWAAA